jgi:hypothetical protein
MLKRSPYLPARGATGQRVGARLRRALRLLAGSAIFAVVLAAELGVIYQAGLTPPLPAQSAAGCRIWINLADLDATNYDFATGAMTSAPGGYATTLAADGYTNGLTVDVDSARAFGYDCTNSGVSTSWGVYTSTSRYHPGVAGVTEANAANTTQGRYWGRADYIDTLANYQAAGLAHPDEAGTQNSVFEDSAWQLNGPNVPNATGTATSTSSVFAPTSSATAIIVYADQSICTGNTANFSTTYNWIRRIQSTGSQGANGVLTQTTTSTNSAYTNNRGSSATAGVNGRGPCVNLLAPHQSDTIVYDNTAPTATLVLPTITNSLSVTPVTSTATDAHSGLWLRASSLDGTYNSAGEEWSGSTAAPATAFTSIPLSGADGNKTVRVRYMDKSGNIVEASSTITLDTTGPTVSSITISEAVASMTGSGSTIVIGSPTAGSAFTVSVAASDTHSTPSSVTCPAVDGFSVDASGASSPFTCTYTRDASALGTDGSSISESVTTTDALGNIGAASTFTVTYDRTAPGVSTGTPSVTGALVRSGTTIYYGAAPAPSTEVFGQAVATYGMTSSAPFSACSTSGTVTTCTFTVPAGVTSVDALAVGGGGGGRYSTSGGGGGGGGALAYGTISVVPGQTLTVRIGGGGTSNNPTATGGGTSTVESGATVLLSAGGGGGASGLTQGSGGTSGGTLREGGGDGGAGGAGKSTIGGGGGGAGGYSAAGGAGGSGVTTGTAGSSSTGGGGGGGGSGEGNGGGGGGGVGLTGAGANGTGGGGGGGASAGYGGTGGSDGADGTRPTTGNAGGSGGTYGGGAGGADAQSTPVGTAAPGAVRLIWGADRAYPSTNTTDRSDIITASTITIAHSLSDTTTVASATCPATFSGFTLSSSTTPALPNSAPTLTCTYTANGSASPVGTTTPSDGSAGDSAGNTTSIGAGFTGVQDALAPTVTISSVIELVSGVAGDASELHVTESGGAYTISIDDSTIPVTQAFRVTYALSDAGSGLASASCPSAPVLGDATGSPFTLAESISPALPGASATLTCTYTGDASDVGVAGTYAAGSANGGTTPDATDGVDNSTAVGTAVTYVVDGTAPTVSSFTSAVSSPTNSSSIEYTLTFSEAVSGIAGADFANAGTATGCTFTPSAATGTTITLTVTTCSTTGTLTPRLTANLVSDLVGNAGPAANSSATTTLTLDRAAPTVSTFSSAVSSPTTSTSIAYTLTFSESVSGIAAGDVENAGTATGCTFTPSAASGSSITLTVTTCSTTGTLQPRLLAGSVSDSATNTGPAADSAATTTLTLDRVAPSVTAGSPSAANSGVAVIGSTVYYAASVSTTPALAQTSYQVLGTYNMTSNDYLKNCVTAANATTCDLVLPVGVSSISGLVVGGGGAGGGITATTSPSGSSGSGGGGGLAYSGSIDVSGCSSLQVVIGGGGAAVALGNGGAGAASELRCNGTTLLSGGGGSGGSQGGGSGSRPGGAGGTSGGTSRSGGAAGGTGGTGGTGSTNGEGAGGGGGAGGYSAAGGAGGAGSPAAGSNGSAATGGGGGGGAGDNAATGGTASAYGFSRAGNGGGVGLLGAGANGSAGVADSGNGGAGSGGSVQAYGGGGGGIDYNEAVNCTLTNTACIGANTAAAGGAGAVRIIWGAGRTYPSTNTTDAPLVSDTGSFSIAYTLSDAGQLASASCPPTLSGFTLSSTISPALPSGSSTLTCTYTGNGAATPSGTTTPSSGSTSDAAGNSTTFADFTGVQDATGPSVSSFTLRTASDSGRLDSDRLTNAAAPVFDLVFGEPVIGVTGVDFTNSGTATGCVFTTSGSGSTYTVTASSCSGGTLIVTFAAGGAYDALYNPSASAATTATVTIDRTAPTLTLGRTTTSPTNSTSLVFRLTAGENLDCTTISSAAGVDFSLTNLTAPLGTITGAGTTTCSIPATSTIAAAASGSSTLTRAATFSVADDAGNAQTAISSGSPQSITVDRITPMITLFALQTDSDSGRLSDDLLTNASSLVFDLDFSESMAAASITSADFSNTGTATGCTFTPAVGETAATFTVTAASCSAGTVILTLAADGVTDTAGNTAPATVTAAATVTIDRTAPTLTLAAVTASPTNSASLSFALTGNEPLNCGTINTSFSTFLNTPDFTATNISGSLTRTGSGTVTCAITVTSSIAAGVTGVSTLTEAAGFSVADDAGNAQANISAGSPASVTVDRQAPSVSAFSCTPAEGSISATSLDCSLTFSEAPESNAFDPATDLTIGGTSSAWTVGSAAGSGTGPYTFTVSRGAPNSDGTLTLQVPAGAINDAATNSSTASSTLSYTIDTTAPTVLSFTSAVSSPTTSTSIAYTLTFSESVSGIAAGDFENAGTATGCTFTPSDASGASITLTVTDCSTTGTLQPRLAALSVADAAGNAAPAANADATTTLVLDRTNPTSGSPVLLESSGALRVSGSTLYYNPSTAGSAAFSVSLDAADGGTAPTDTGSGIATVTFPSISGLGTGGVNGPADDTSAPYTSTGAAAGLYTFGSGSITASGTNTVTVTDGAGNTATSSFTLTADGSAPSITWTTPAAGSSFGSSTSISLAFSTSDGGAGLASASLQRERAAISIPGSCAGVAWSNDGAAVDVLGESSLAVSGLSSGYCYRYTITATDRVGNEASSTSGTRLVDASAPSLSIGVTGGGAISGTTVYFKGSASGTLTVTATAVDADSGIEKVVFGALTNATGYTPGVSLPDNDTSEPYALTIDYTAAAVTSSMSIAAHNGVGTTTTSTLTLVADGAGPSITFTSPVSFAMQTATTISADWDESDTSGVASRSVQRQKAAIVTPGSCAGVSWSSDGAATTTVSPREDSNLASGYCYRYTIAATDLVGNESSTTSAAILIDASAPTTPTVSETGVASYLTGGTLFFRAGTAGSATLTATASDAQSAISFIRFAGSAPSGWSPSGSFAETDATDPYTVELSWDTEAAGGWTLAIDARNGAQSYGSAIELAVTADGTAPEGTFTTPAGGAQATGSISVDWTESDGAGSGIASRSLQRYVGTIVTPGSCLDVADWTVSGAATTTAAPRSDTGLTTGFCYRYVLTLTDRVGNTSETTSSAVLVDTTAPDAPSVTATGAGIYQSAANGTIFFLPVADGSLALVATSSDAESGTASITFGAPSVTTGWTTTSGATDATSPYTRSYLFGATAVSSSIEVTATNGAGTASSATTLTLTADADAPTAGFTTPDETDTVAVTDGTYEVAWTESDGSGSGVVSRSLQRQRVAIDDTDCPALGWTNDGAATTTESPRAESGLLDGYCYRYRLTLVDGVGNSSTTTSGELIVDSSAPDAPEVTASGGKTHQVGTTVYFGAGSGTISFTATATDDGSGIALVSFGATDDDTDPYEHEESFTEASSSSTLTVTATNGVDTASNPTVLSLVPDRTAPSAAFSSPAAGLTRQSTATTGITWSSSDAGSGVATRSLQREIAEIPSTGSCTDATWTTDGLAESVVAAGSATVEGLTDARCYRWTLTVTDNVGNETVTTSGGVLVDTSAPSTPSATASGTGIYQSAADAVVYFRAGVAGSLSISVTAADAESGVTLVRFAYATGASTSGWTPSATLPAEDAVSPYTLGLAWSESAASTALEIIARNGTGADSAIRTLTISADGNAPTVSITSPTSPTTSTNGNLSVTYSATDGGSGVASVAVQRYRAAIPGSLDCTEVATWSTDGLPTSGASPREDTGLASGYCYRYGVTATDRVGNAASESFSAPTVVDSSAPDAPTLELSADAAGKLYVAAGGTVWFRAGSGGTLTIAVTAADTQTGVDTITFAALTSTTGWSPTSAATTSYNAAASNTKSYTWSGGASGATFSVSATNGAGSTGAAATLTLTADAAAPTVTWTSPAASTTSPTGASTSLVFAISDADSGVASSSLQRQRVATNNGACPASPTWSNDGAATSSPASPLAVSGLEAGYCYRWILTATDRVGQETSATSGILRVETDYALTGIPEAIDYGAGAPGDLVSASQFEAIAGASSAYVFRIEVGEMSRTGGAPAVGDVIGTAAFRFLINGTTYYAGSSGIIELQKNGASVPGGDSYLVTPRLLLPFVSNGNYGGTITFTVDGIGQ